jgi:uncharacterized RDD family membrane protein YckC
MKSDEAKYAGIGLRVPAAIIDAIVFAGLNLLILPLENYSYIVPKYLWSVFALAFNVFFLVKFGATPGKLIMKIKVVKTSLEPISYKEAFLRLYGNILTNVLYLIAFTTAFKSFSYETYRVMSYLEKARYMATFYPIWFHNTQVFFTWWLFGDSALLLFNKKKRALHDFIAGTVVIIRPDTYEFKILPLRRW